jgi:hypothetical protein
VNCDLAEPRGDWPVDLVYSIFSISTAESLSLRLVGHARHKRYPYPSCTIAPQSKGLTLSPDTFEIVVRGVHSTTGLAAFDGFDIQYCTDGHTHLVGIVPDHSTFNRLLQSLLQLDIELVSVNPVRDE